MSLGEPKWYPAFNIGDGGCINDGLENVYFRRFSKYLFDSEQECCEFYYPMNAQGCIEPRSVEDPCSEEFQIDYWGIYNEDFLLEPEIGFYPSFSEDSYCVNDGNAPAYMITSPQNWKRKSITECCYSFYQFAYRECMGDSPNDEGGEIELPLCIQLPELSGDWYLNDLPDRGVYECVRECSGRKPCNGRASCEYFYNIF